MHKDAHVFCPVELNQNSQTHFYYVILLFIIAIVALMAAGIKSW